MTLENTIETDWRAAVKSNEKLKKSILSLIRSEFKNKMHEAQADPTWDRALGLPDIVARTVLQKMIKQRKEAIELMSGRPDLMAKENYECIVIQGYLPVPPTTEDIRQTINKVILDIGATSIKDVGKVMAKVVAEYKGSIDGKDTIALVRSRLGQIEAVKE